MSSLKYQTFLGAMPYMDPSLIPEANSWVNRDCWFVDGTLRPIKEAALDSTLPAPSSNTETLYRYRPCPRDPSQAYWIQREGSYNVAPSPIASDKYGRLFFTRQEYTPDEAAELPHFYDVKGLVTNRATNETLCSSADPEFGTYPANDENSYTLGVPSPISAEITYTGGEFAIATSTDGTTWTKPENYQGTAYAFLTVLKGTSRLLAGGYNGAIAYSDDGGDTWAQATVPEDAAAYTIRSFAEGGGVFIAGCNDGRLLTSTDGAEWTIPEYANGKAFVEGHITAAFYFAGRFHIGTTSGYGRRIADSKSVSDTENPWENVPGVTNTFRVTDTNGTTINPIYGGAVLNDSGITVEAANEQRGFFVGGAKTGKVARYTNSGWAAYSGHGMTKPIQHVAANLAQSRIVLSSADSYQIIDTTTTYTVVKILDDTFGGASYFKTTSGAWKKVLHVGFTADSNPFIVGEKGAYAFKTSNVVSEWIGTPTGFGETQLNYVLYTGAKYIFAANDQAATNQEIQTRYYAITFIDGYGEEGAPILTTKVSATANGAFDLTWKNPTFYVREDGTPITSEVWTGNAYAIRVNKTNAKYYIYRTASSGTTTEFLYVDEVDYDPDAEKYTYTDSKKDEELGEVMLSTDWIPPPPKLRGLVTLPGGVLAGFVDNTLWFSEPGQPHAWPVKYQRTVSAPIVGLSTFANSVLVTTIDRSYVASGIDPFNMSLTELETDQSCISANSVVDMGGSAIYASPRGLVRVSNMTPEWITKQLFTPAQWAQLNPASIRATVWEGRYLAFFDGQPPYASRDIDGVTTYPTGMSIVPGADVDGVSWYSASGSFPFTDAYDDKVYFLSDGDRYIWNDGETNATCFWRGKLLQSPESLSFSWLQVQANLETTVRYYSEEGWTLVFEAVLGVTDNATRVTPFTATEYNGDGTVKATFSGNAQDGTIRLPAGRRSRFHVVEIETQGRVRQVLFTQSGEELRST